jgi:hypothetical protein
MQGEAAAPFEGATPDRVTGVTGVGAGRHRGGEVAFPVAPGEAFCASAGVWAGAARAEAILELRARGSAAGPAGPGGRARSATIEVRLPPPGWRRGVPLPPSMVREEHLFVASWGGVAPLAGCHGDLGLLEPGSVFASRDGTRLPDAGALEAEASAMLQELGWLLATMSVEGRLRHRVVQLMDRAGVGTATGIRLHLGLTHVQWPLLVGAPEAALAAAFEHLARDGSLLVEGRSLTIPWEAWPELALEA